MRQSNRTSNVWSACAAALLAGACESRSAPAPDQNMTLNQVVAAMTLTLGEATTPLCELKLAQWSEPREVHWYSCRMTPEVYASLPIGTLDDDDFARVGGIAWEAELRRLHGASNELPALHPRSPAYRLGWREGDRLTGLGMVGTTLVANLEREGRDL